RAGISGSEGRAGSRAHQVPGRGIRRDPESTMTRLVGRHTSSGNPGRLARPVSAALALTVVAFAGVCLVGTVDQPHVAEARAVRAAELREVAALATRERTRVVRDGHHSAPALTKQIDAGASALVSLLRDVDRR